MSRQISNGQRGEELNAGWRFHRGDAPGAHEPTFDDSMWRVLDLPHDFGIELEFNERSPSGSSGGYLDGGIGWYRRAFALPTSASNQRVLLQFDGVYANSEVSINGTFLGKRPYGYSTFEYDLTPFVKVDGTGNVVAVKVNNDQPNSRWYSGSGIYRNVWLTRLHQVHIPNSGVFVTTPAIDETRARVRLTTDVRNQSMADTSVTVSTTVTDAAGTVVAHDESATHIASGDTASIERELSVPSPKLWSPALPYLYRATVELRVGGATIDRYVTSLGLRTPRFDAQSGFSLNGQGMQIQGVNMHHDLGALGAAVDYRAIERQVEILKTMGVNFIRTSHNPPAPELLDVADRLGMMILDEAFDTWTQPKTDNDYARHFEEWAERDIEDMVRRDRNHPSVILYSIGNEIYGATTAIARSLVSSVRALDETRPVTWASNKMAGPRYAAVDHEIAALLDVVGYNYAGYAGDYDADHLDHPEWRLLGTETAAAVSSRGVYHPPASTVTKTNDGTSPSRQCSSYDNEAARFGETAEVAHAIDRDRPFVAGSFIWAGFDYLGEPTPYSSWPSKSSYYGVVDTAGFPKDVFYFYQSRWTSEPMVHLLPHWNWSAGTQVTVYAYSNCDSVELFLNDVSQGEHSMSGALRAEWRITWTPGTLRATGKKGGKIVADDVVETAGAAARITLTPDRASIRADGRDLVFVTADIEDDHGIVVPTAENVVSFSVTGPGILVGLDNGNPIDTTSFKATSRRAFSGKLLAIVRATRDPGSIVVHVTSAGLTGGPLKIQSG